MSYLNLIALIVLVVPGLAGVVMFISSCRTMPASAPPSENSSAWSWVLFGLAVCSNLAVLGLGVIVVRMFSQEMQFGVMFFLLAGCGLALSTLLLVSLPSWFFLKRTQERRHRLSLRLSCLTLFLLLVELVALVMFGR